jgi:hypothetical protein
MTTRFLGTAFLVLSGVTFALTRPATAQNIMAPSPLEQSMQAAPGAPAEGQRYDGVVPGTAAKNPLPAAPKGGAHLVWTGFQMTPTGSRVFLQTTQPVQFDLDEGRVAKSGKSTLAVRLEGCRIHMANNRRKIDTRFFATPVSGVSARQKGHNVEVRIALREVASAVPHSESGPDGTQFLVFDFPPGKATPEPTALQDMAKAAAPDEGGGQTGVDEQPATRPAKKARKSAR